MCKKILLVGGGTGGHAFPLLNFVFYIRSRESKEQGTRYKEVDFHWIGEKNSIEEKLCEKNSIQFSPIICGKLRRYFSLKTLFLPFQVIIGTLQSLKILFIESPI